MLILCDKSDSVCLALYTHLLAENAGPRLVTADELVFARSWCHSLDSQGKTSTTIELQNGEVISSSYTGSVFNRIRFLSMRHFSEATDRSYAEMEMNALYASFLKSIDHLLMEPLQTRHLGLEQENIFFYSQKAVEAGIPVLDYHFTSSPRAYSSPGSIAVPLRKNALESAPFRGSAPIPGSAPYLAWQDGPALFLQPFTASTVVCVAGSTILCDEPMLFHDEIGDFAKSIGRGFMELHFAKTDEQWKLYHVDAFPTAVRPGVIEALADWITKGPERTE